MRVEQARSDPKPNKENQMSNSTIVVPDDSAIVATNYEPLKAGVYDLEIVSVEFKTFGDSSKFAGEPGLNFQFKTVTNRRLYKLVPLFAVDETSPKGAIQFVQMSRVSLVQALNITNAVLIKDHEKLVGKTVRANVTVQERRDMPGTKQNQIANFVK
jgi:hypothetical protein